MKFLTSLPLIALLAGCTSPNGTLLCVPGEQKACDCPGGTTGAQICNAEGAGFDTCLGCPGGPQLPDLLAPADMSIPPGSDLSIPPGSDLSIPPGSDLSVP